MMDKSPILRAYDSMTPDQASRDRMLDSILAAAPGKKSGGYGLNRRYKRIVSIAAVVAVLTALSIGAYASDWFGLGSTMIEPQEIQMESGETQQVDMISLQGFSDSAEYAANMEWQEFYSSYDQDGAILAEIGNSATEFDEKYNAYICYTQEMADKIDEICEEYSLKLLGKLNTPENDEDFFSLAKTGQIYTRSSADWENTVYLGYVHEDGTFKFDGDLRLLSPEVNWSSSISYEFIRCMKGYFNSSILNIGNINDYEQWNYTTSNGVELVLAQSDNKELIIVDRGESFVVVNLYNVSAANGTAHKSAAALEAVAECFDFTAIP